MFPIILETESLTLYTYPVFFALAWAMALQYVWYQLKENHKDFILFSFISFIAAWAGAKLVFLLSVPATLVGIIGQFNFWTGGGFVFYGGMIAALLTTLVWRLVRSSPFNMNLIIPGICLGHGIGRIGCFLTGCCFGHSMNSGGYFPVALVESLILFSLFIYFHKRKEKNFYELLKNYLIAYACIRFALEYFRADEIRGVYGIFSTSQWISLSIVVISPVVNLFYFLKTPSR